MQNLIEIAWLAALLEGEGSFDLVRGRYPRIGLEMNDKDIVERAAQSMENPRITFCDPPSKRGKGKPSFKIEVSGFRAVRVMKTILPQMGARRSARIIELLEVWNTRSGKHSERDRSVFPLRRTKSQMIA